MTRALHICRRLAAAALLLMAMGLAQADPNIRVLALFPGKAMLSVDGSNQTFQPRNKLVSPDARLPCASLPPRINTSYFCDY